MQGLSDEESNSEIKSSDQQLPATETADTWLDEEPKKEETIVRAHFEPETPAENVRRMGLAWSAGIAFFGAIVFMLFIGWIADVLLGSSPWGLVGGIILGSIIGFVQFFRISSQIFRPNANTPEVTPLHVSDIDEERRR
jgi:F0F1-type ATP synthase assembly protein I